MLQRQLARAEVDGRMGERLATSGIRSYRQLLQRSRWDVAQAADLSMTETTELISRLSMRLAPPPQSAFDLFLKAANNPLTLRTGLSAIDAALDGGLRVGGLHEIAGPPEIGKTQLAMTLAVRCAIDYPESQVLYYDTERGFSAVRAREIAHARLKDRHHSGQDVDDAVINVLKRIRVQPVGTLAEFGNHLKGLDRQVHAWRVRLVILDSVAALLVKAHGLTFAQKESHAMRIARHLKYVGHLYEVFVLVTNRASTVENDFGSFTKPALTETWAHCVTSRFVMERHPMSLVLTIVKSPSADHVVQPYTITSQGIEHLEEPQWRPDDEDDEFAINDDVLKALDIGAFTKVDPSGTVRSTQQSEIESESQRESEAKEDDCRDEGANSNASQHQSDDIVSDSNDEESDTEVYRGDSPSMWFKLI